jgi:hypothetical protein
LKTAPLSYGKWRRVLLAAGFLYLTILGWSRMQQALLDWDLLVSLGARPGPLYLAASGAAWGVLGLAAVALVFIPRDLARLAIFFAALAMALWHWADFLFLTRAAEMMGNWPFSLAMTVLGLLYCAWAVGLFHPRKKAGEA